MRSPSDLRAAAGTRLYADSTEEARLLCLAAGECETADDAAVRPGEAGFIVLHELLPGAHKYCEFKALDQTWLLWEGEASPVPASRAEVFRDRSMPPGDKRALMRFLKRVVALVRRHGHCVRHRQRRRGWRAAPA